MPSKPEGRYRRQRRKFVNKLVGMPMERYDEHVREHASRDKPSNLEDAFEERRFGGVASSKSSDVEPEDPKDAAKAVLIGSEEKKKAAEISSGVTAGVQVQGAVTNKTGVTK